MKKKIKSLGIIGCGSVVRNFYVPFIRNFQEIKLKYITDINSGSAEELASILKCKFIPLEKLIEKSHVIIIATPPSTHYKLIKSSIKKNKTIICEKPFVSSLSEAKELIDLSKSMNVRLYIAHIRRCFPSVTLAKSIVETGIMGNLKEISLQEGGKFNYESKSNYVYENKLGGVLLDTGSHTIDTALFLTNLHNTNIDNININNFWVSSKEPSHEIKVKLSLKSTTIAVNLNIHLSRLKVLANKICLIYENGEINIPTEFSNYIKVTGGSGSSRIYSNEPYSDFMDMFPIQVVLDNTEADWLFSENSNI